MKNLKRRLKPLKARVPLSSPLGSLWDTELSAGEPSTGEPGRSSGK